MIRSLKNANFYGKPGFLKVDSRINQKLPGNQTNHFIKKCQLFVLKKQVILLEENNFYSTKSWHLKVEKGPVSRPYSFKKSIASDIPA